MKSEATNLGFIQYSGKKHSEKIVKAFWSRQAVAVVNKHLNCGSANPGLVPGKFKEFWPEWKQKANPKSSALCSSSCLHSPAYLPWLRSLRWESSNKQAQTKPTNGNAWLGLVPACALTLRALSYTAGAPMMIKAVWSLCSWALCS